MKIVEKIDILLDTTKDSACQFYVQQIKQFLKDVIFLPSTHCSSFYLPRAYYWALSCISNTQKQKGTHTSSLTPNLHHMQVRCVYAPVQQWSWLVSILVNACVYTGCVCGTSQIRSSRALQRKYLGLLWLPDAGCTTRHFSIEQIARDGMLGKKKQNKTFGLYSK